MADSAVNKDKIEEKNRRIAEDKIREKKVYTGLCGTYEGRELLWRSMQDAGTFSSSYKPGEAKELVYFREGLKINGLLLLNRVLEYNPESFLVMYHEAKDRANRSEN